MTTAKPRVALYEFMPYGAPELLECERTNLSRAMLASMLVLTLTGLTLALVLPRVVARGEPDVPWTHEFSPSIFEPPPPLPDFDLPRVAPAPPAAAARGGDVTPVRDELAEPDALVPSQAELAQLGPAATDEPGNGAGVGEAPPVAEPDPEPGVWVPMDEPPALVQSAQPVYPELAKAAGVEGTVVVLAKIGRDGRVAEVRIAPGRSIPLLDEAALAAVRRFVYTPALSHQHPVVVWVSQRVVFKLH